MLVEGKPHGLRVHCRYHRFSVPQSKPELSALILSAVHIVRDFDNLYFYSTENVLFLSGGSIGIQKRANENK